MKTLILVFTISVFFFGCNSEKRPDITSRILTENSKNKISEMKYFPNGEISEVEFILDSFDIKSNTLFKSVNYHFFENGNLKEKSYQGEYKTIGCAVGISEKYNEKGRLILKIVSHNDDFGKDYILYKHYMKGKLTKTEKFNNFELYETTKKRIE